MVSIHGVTEHVKIWARQNCHIHLRGNIGAQILLAENLFPNFFTCSVGRVCLPWLATPMMPRALIIFIFFHLHTSSTKIMIDHTFNYLAQGSQCKSGIWHNNISKLLFHSLALDRRRVLWMFIKYDFWMFYK